MKKRLTIEFPNQELLDKFCGWFSDGGGEYDYLRDEDKPLGFDYTYVFPAWGYDPQKHGSPLLRLIDLEEENYAFKSFE